MFCLQGSLVCAFTYAAQGGTDEVRLYCLFYWCFKQINFVDFRQINTKIFASSDDARKSVFCGETLVRFCAN